MKVVLILLFLIITVESIQSKILYRTYIIRRDNIVREKQLSAYSVFDSSGKKNVYRLKCTSTDIDTIMVYDEPTKNMTANLEGEWVDKVFDVTFSIYDKKLNTWIDGVVKKVPATFRKKYSIEWNSKRLNVQTSMFTSTIRVYQASGTELVAEIRKLSFWHGINDTKFRLKIYSQQYPNEIFFFILAMNDHQVQIANS